MPFLANHVRTHAQIAHVRTTDHLSTHTYTHLYTLTQHTLTLTLCHTLTLTQHTHTCTLHTTHYTHTYTTHLHSHLHSHLHTCTLHTTHTLHTHTLHTPHTRLPWPSTAQAVEAVVREHGSVPATIGVLNGHVHIGMMEADLRRLAEPKLKMRKISRRDLSYVISKVKAPHTLLSCIIEVWGGAGKI